MPSKKTNWIKLHRKIRKSNYYPKDKFTKFEAFIDILLMVKWQDGKKKFDNHYYNLKAGELITKQRILAKRWDWSLGKVNTFINGNGLTTKKVKKKLNQSAEPVSRTSGLNQFITKIIVVNWKDYQGELNQSPEHEIERRIEPLHKEGYIIKKGIHKEEQSVEGNFNFAEKLKSMLENKQRHIQIIGLYWKYTGITFENKKQYQATLKENLKAAKKLDGYSNNDIKKAMDILQNSGLTWSLYAIGRNIAEIKAGNWRGNKNKDSKGLSPEYYKNIR